MPVLFALQQLLTLWMLYDAIQRRAEPIWYFVILMPFGEIIYFASVKWHDPEIQRAVQGVTTGRPKLSELRYNARMSPSAYNRAKLARGLHDARQHEEAAVLFEELIREDPSDDKLRLAGAINALALDDAAGAIDLLEPVVERDLAFDGFSAAAQLATAYRATGNADRAVALLRRIVERSQRIVPRVALAELLMERQEATEARSILQAALDDYQHSPRFVQRNEAGAARRARKLLRELSTAAA